MLRVGTAMFFAIAGVLFASRLPALAAEPDSRPAFGLGIGRVEEEAKILLPARGDGKRTPIPDLVFSKRAPRIQMTLSWNARNGVTVLATFRARFQKAGYMLLAGPSLKPVSRDRDGIFTIVADIQNSKQKYLFAMVDPSGKLTREWIIIQVPKYDYFVQTGQKNPRRFFMNVGMGLSSISYDETNTGDTTNFSSFALTPKVSIQYLMPSPYWSLGFTGYITGLQLKSSLDATARFIGLNLRTGYRIPAIREPWQVVLMAGYYYTTSLVSSGTFGYRNIGGPQFYPTVRRAFRSGDFASAYFKFSPIANSVNILNFGNRELGAGINYTFSGRSSNPWSAYLDVSQIKLDLPAIEFEMSTSSITLGASYGF
jgi:hypothetical protein